MPVRRSAILLALASFAAFAQTLLDNATVGKLVKAGVGEQLILTMIDQQPGKYALSTDDLVALKKVGVSDKILAAMIVRNAAAAPSAPVAPPSPVAAPAVQPPPPAAVLTLHDSTPIRLRLARTLSSSTAKVGDTVDLETLDELRVDGVLVVDRGATAIATVTEAEEKKRLARGGKLGLNIDYVRLVNGDKVALRATKEGKGGGHTGAMTGAMVATAVVFWPAAPLFLFMHGKDVTFPRGTEITAYVDGEIMLGRDRFLNGGAVPPAPVTAQALPIHAAPPAPPPAAVAQTLPVRAAPPAPPPPAAPQPVPAPVSAASVPTAPARPPQHVTTLLPGGLVEMAFTSNPPGAKVSMYGTLVGRTPFTTKLEPGTYKVVFSVSGYPDLTENISVGPGLSSVAHAAFAMASTQ